MPSHQISTLDYQDAPEIVARSAEYERLPCEIEYNCSAYTVE